MSRCRGFLLLGFALLAGCIPTPAPIPTATPAPARPTRTPPPPPTPILTPTVEAIYEGRPLSTYQGTLFAASGACTPCHQGMTDDMGADVSIDSAWRASLEANAAIDPFFLAVAQAETTSRPEPAGQIEDTCAKCHMPMASTTLAEDDELARIFEDGLLNPKHELHELATDGVSCTLCHQITESGLGFPDSYGGGYEIDTSRSPGERLIYGPYSVEEEALDLMQISSGYVPTQGLHIAQSELCATCHTLFTSGQFESGFPLQATYMEWFYSDYRRVRSCQDCHMPEAVGGVRIASSSEYPRSPFNQHLFPGSNAYMLELFGVFAEEFDLAASAAEISESHARTLAFMGSEAAQVVLEEIQLSGSRLRVDVRVENDTGHKLPTGFPSRRAWLHFTVMDPKGTVLFESGGWDDHGRILEDDRNQDPTAIEPHYVAIVQPEQVQIYEAIPRDAAGVATTSWTRAVGYLKDNRLPPIGFDASDQIGSIRVWGRAVEDENFLGGEDSIQYALDLGAAQGPFTVEVELLYQSIATPWAGELRRTSAPEVDRFLRFYDQLPNAPIPLASASETVGGD